jgi:putative effector of murein hydrolase
MYATRSVLSIGISILTFLIAVVLDTLFGKLRVSPILQIVVHIPLLILIMEELRRHLIEYHEFSRTDVAAAFFLAAPIAALGSPRLFKSLSSLW